MNIDPSQKLSAGTAVGQRYVVLRVLGEGGMGQVALVRQNLTNKVGAMKLLTAMAPELVERFNREAAAPSRLNHAAFPAVFDFGEHLGLPYIVMDVVDGETIADVMRRGHPFSLAEVVEIGRQVCDAMATAHEAGLVHRDLKAENIMIEAPRAGAVQVHVLDLGIARFSASTGMEMGTRTGTLIGTPATMSPEQAQGMAVDGRSDIYSFGCVLFFMATGRYPFEASEPLQLAMQHVLHEAPSARQFAPWLPPPFSELIARTLHKEKAARFQSMSDLDAALAVFEGAMDKPPAHTEPLATTQNHPSGSRPRGARPSGSTPPPKTTLQPRAEVAPPEPATLGTLSRSAREIQSSVTAPSRSSAPIVVTALVLVALIGSGGVWWWTHRSVVPAAQAKVVTAQPTQPTEPTEATPSRIFLHLSPSDARVTRDGQALADGTSVASKPGERAVLSIVADGYEPMRVELQFSDHDENRAIALVKHAAVPVAQVAAPPPVAKPTHHTSHAKTPGKSSKDTDLPDSM